MKVMACLDGWDEFGLLIEVIWADKIFAELCCILNGFYYHLKACVNGPVLFSSLEHLLHTRNIARDEHDFV